MFIVILGINYGFEVMKSAESVNVPFTIFRTRFTVGMFIQNTFLLK